MSWLEPQVERQPEAAARWIWRQVDEARHEIPTVVDLRIEAVVSRNDEQVPSRKADLPALRAPDACHHFRRQLVGQIHLADLGERSVNEVSLCVGATAPRVVAVCS